MNVETDMAYAYDVALRCLNGETGIDEKHRRLALFIGSEGMMPDGECCKGALHRSCCWDAAKRIDVNTDECLYKLRCRVLYPWYSPVRRIDSGTAVGKCFLLGTKCYVGRLQSRNAHLKVNHCFACFFLKGSRQALYVSYGSLREVAETHLFYGLGDYVII